MPILQVHPFSMMIHRPTFLSRLGYGRVPGYLLNSILALAAPFSSHPSIRKASRDSPQWQSGQIFGELAQREMFDENDVFRFGEGNREGQELELCQALICLGFHYAAMRPIGYSQSPHFAIASEILNALGVPDWGVGEDPASHSTSRSLSATSASNEAAYRAKWRRRECLRRTFWVVHFINLGATTFAFKPMPYRCLDVRLYLPVDDGVFDLVVPDDTVPGDSHMSNLGWASEPASVILYYQPLLRYGLSVD